MRFSVTMSRMFKNTSTPSILGCVLAAVLIAPSVSAAETETGWDVRVGATCVDGADKSEAFSALGINFAADSVSVPSKLISEMRAGGSRLATAKLNPWISAGSGWKI